MPNWKIVAAGTALAMTAAAVMVGVAYARTPVPTAAQQTATSEASVITYRDGKTQLGAKIGMNRELVKLKQVPDHVKNAVLAAEHRTFYSDPGISPTGVTRAVFKTATGGDVQGGSTITQQMARNYYAGLSQERSLSRKMKEIFISMKVGKELDKDTILELYLNTISFGRQAYGIQAAADAYFRRDVSKLTVTQGAMLAAMIQRPSYFVTSGPDSNPAKKALIERWEYVLDGMVEEKWLSEADRAKQKFPETVKNWSSSSDKGQAGYLKQQVLRELKSIGVTEQMLETGGYKITTTFDKELQDYSAALVNQIRRENRLNSTFKFGLTSVDPQTGAVRAAYGGPDYMKDAFDASFQAKTQPGSSFKPIVLATALEQGYGLKSTLDGKYEMEIAGTKFKNDNRGENGIYNFVQMTQMSINTSYVMLGQKIGLQNVVDNAVKMGIPRDSEGLNATYTSLPLGPLTVRTVDMASVYSTFANKGTHAPAHVVEKVVDSTGKKLPLTWQSKKQEVFSPDVAADATYAMQAVVKPGGTGTKAAVPGRPVAGKTGTTDKNRSAWFVGYTPQLATAVSMWRAKKSGKLLSLVTSGGQIYGGDIPAATFSRFMTKAHEGKPAIPFPPPANVGTTKMWATPPPPEEPEPDDGRCGPRDPLRGIPGRCPPDGGDQNPGDLPACESILVRDCDPNKIPTREPYRSQWCSVRPTHPECRRSTPSPPPPGQPNNPGNGQDDPQTQQRALSRTDD